jgi:ABC-type amino acid transport substrate-binding protein
MRVMRARYARRETADAGSVLGWLRIVFVAASILILVAPANAQESANVGALSGTLKKIKDTGTITLGYRESSLPFSYLNRRQQPIGYSIDLCREIVEDARDASCGGACWPWVTPYYRLCAPHRGVS